MRRDQSPWARRWRRVFGGTLTIERFDAIVARAKQLRKHGKV